MQLKHVLISVTISSVLGTLLACYTPAGGRGYKKPILDCEPMKELLRLYERDKSEFWSKYIYKSFLTEEDKKDRIVCCPDDLNTTLNFQNLGAEILRNVGKECGDNTNKRISFGSETTFMVYPWSALLVYATPQRFHCGGTLVTNRYILTAAHCVAQNYYPLIGVRLREHNITSDIDCARDDNDVERCYPPVLDVGIDKVIIHKDYSRITHDNDIALIRLDRTILFERVLRPICIPEYDEEFHKNFGSITGWGATENSTLSDVLMEAEVPIHNLSHCQGIYRHSRMSEKKICASGVNAVNTCKGDSGGPLFLRMEGFDTDRKFRYLQVGVTSLGVGSCGDQRHFPAVFTRVASYVNWIASNIEM